MLPTFLTNINWVSAAIKTFILLVVTKLPVRENTFTPKGTNHSTANKRYRVPMRNRCGADQTVAEPTAPRLGSWSIRTQTAKPANQGGEQTAGRPRLLWRSVAVPSTQPKDPPRPSSHPAQRTTPASGEPRSCSRGISRLTEPRGKGALPAGKPGTHVQGRGATGRRDRR